MQDDRMPKSKSQPNPAFSAEDIVLLLPNNIYVFDLRLKTSIYANRDSTSYLGYTEEQILGMGEDFLPTVIHPDFLGFMLRHYEEMKSLPDGQVREFIVKVKNAKGEWQWMLTRESVFKRDENGTPIHVIGVAQDISALKTRERELEDAENRFHALADSSPDGILIHDGENIIDCNQAFATLFGYGHGDEMKGLPLTQIIAEEKHSFLKEQIGKRTEVTYVIGGRRKDGSTFLIEVIGRNCVYNGKTARVGSVRDFTEQQRARISLIESEHKFKRLFDLAPIGMGLVDMSGRFTQVNPALCLMLGYEPEELLAMTLADITLPEDQNVTPVQFEKLLNGELNVARYEKHYMHKDGHLVWAEFNTSIRRDSTGKIIGFMSQVIDQTARRRTEASLRETTQTLQNLIESAPLAICLLDRNGIVQLWNPASEKTFGWTAAEAIGRFLPFVPPESVEHAKNNIRLIFEIEKVVGLEATRKKRDGSDIIVSISAVPMIGPTGEVDTILAIISDVSQAKAAEHELRTAREQAELAARAKSEFLANMSHEIRTPLNGIMGMTGLLLDTALDQEQRDYTETINRSALSLLSVINDVLDFSKIEAGKMDFEEINFDLRDAVLDIDRMMAVLAEKKGIQLITEISPELPRVVCGDPGRFRQILLNLVGNAVKFTNRGSVKIKAQALSVDGESAKLRFEVIDTGIGMKPEVVGRLFQAFTQGDSSMARRYGGTGLGLSISKKLIEQMGGEIGAASEHGKGTTFWFTAQLKKGSLEQLGSSRATTKSIEASSKPDGHFRILVAEDNPVNQVITVKMLQKEGFRVDAVANGKEVITSLRQIPYDLILMDCQMPEMDGYEATIAIRQSDIPRAQQIPIIALTANAMPGDTEKCLAAGMDDYLPKPIRQETIISKVNEWLVSKPIWQKGAV